MSLTLPDNHPLRFELNNEVHARPPEPLTAPFSISYIALYNAWSLCENDVKPVVELAQEYGITPPEGCVNHFTADFGSFRLKWERHTEFTRYILIEQQRNSETFQSSVVSQLPDEWLQTLPGQIIVATNVSMIEGPQPPNNVERLSEKYFNGNVLIGSSIAAGAATALTDFKIGEDGFSRLWMANHGMRPWQTGRMVQRLLELDTYRMLALLALPVAKKLGPHVSSSEQELVEITAALNNDGESEAALLDRLTRLQAEIEQHHSENHYRFGAAAAYFKLVQRRISELREERIRGIQNFREFTERRLVPAMETCHTVAERQESLSTRVARATQLLSTRVDMARREQNQNVLESMNRRAELQLRLQTTVEGLSIAAITYYIVGLVAYGVKGIESLGLALNSTVVTAVSIPVVACGVALGIRKIRKKVVHLEES